MVVIADLGVFAWSTEWRTFAMPIAAARAYPHQKGDLAFGPVVDAPGGIDRAANESGTYTNSNTTKGVLSVNGYDPIFPKDYGVALGDMNQYGGVYRPDIWSAHTWVADLLRVTTLALNTAGTNGTESLGPVWTKLRLAVGYPETVWTRQPRLNDVFTVGEVRVTTFLGAVAALRGDGSVPGVIPPLPTLDASQTALVDGSCAECRGLGAPGPAGEVQAVSRSPNRWRAAVTMRRAGLVVFSRAYLPGTHASVDRHSVPVRRVDALVSGFVVPAGPHRIAIWYEAPGLKLGALLAMVGLLSLLGWAIVEHRRVSRAESAGSPTPGGSVAAFRLTTSPAGSP